MALRFPTEILDQILSEIGSRKDILSFALASHGTKEICIPRHSEYRIICAPFEHKSLWAHLASHRHLTRNVRILRVTSHEDQSSLEWPLRAPSNANHSFGDPKSNFLTAVAAMTALEAFYWSSHFDLTSKIEQELEYKIHSKVLSCNTLKHFSHSGLGHVDPDSKLFDRYPFNKMTNLTSLSLYDAGFLCQYHPTELYCMLRECQNLEVLRIHVECREHSNFFYIHRLLLPHLHTFSFCIEPFGQHPMNERAFGHFLMNCPSLENLEWEGLPPIDVRPGALSHLRHLHGVDDGNRLLQFITPSRALQSLSLFPLTQTHLNALKTMNGATLQKLELSYFDSLELIRELAKLFPNLKHLRIPSADYQHDPDEATNVPIHIAEWPAVINLFPKLEVFRGVSFFKDPLKHCSIEDIDNDSRAMAIMSICPTLICLDHWDSMEDEHKMIVLLREGEKPWSEMATWEYERISKDPFSMYYY